MCQEPQEIQAVCAACGESPSLQITSMLDLLRRLTELGWGMVDPGLLVCPPCVERISNRVARMANAHLN